MQGFRSRLAARQKAVNSLVCVGLDPLMERTPQEWLCRGSISDAAKLWMTRVVDATAPFASMFKPQRAHWEAIFDGERALAAVISYIKTQYPEIPVFLDCKRGDIDRTQQQYRHTHFELDGADGMNYNPYMGRGTLENLIDRDHLERALVGLGRTSNQDAWEIQDLMLQTGRRLWEDMVERILDWSSDLGVLANAGVVMGAAHKDPNNPLAIYSQHLRRAKEIHKGALWTLIPGIGTQGGFIKETVEAAFVGPGWIAINSSSGIIFADDPAGAAEKLRDQIRAAGGSC